jgi:hypothetical protein
MAAPRRAETMMTRGCIAERLATGIGGPWSIPRGERSRRDGKIEAENSIKFYV